MTKEKNVEQGHLPEGVAATSSKTQEFAVEIYENSSNKCEGQSRTPYQVFALNPDGWVHVTLVTDASAPDVKISVFPRWDNSVAEFSGSHPYVIRHSTQSSHPEHWHWVLLQNRDTSSNPVKWPAGVHTPKCNIKIIIKPQ